MIGYQDLTAGFPIFHINAPGQEDGAQSLPGDYKYPSMEQPAEQVQEVINTFKIVKYIGLGVGLGANVLTRHSLAYPERVESLVLVNTVITKAGWVEWGYQKRNVSHLRTTGITQTVQEYLLWHHLGDDYNDRAHDLLQVYKDYFAHNVNPLNLAGLVEQFHLEVGHPAPQGQLQCPGPPGEGHHAGGPRPQLGRYPRRLRDHRGHRHLQRQSGA